jgi:hypothetical protein
LPDGSFAEIQLDMGTTGFAGCTGLFATAVSPSVITNAGTGVAVFAPVSQWPGGDCTVAPASSLQISYVPQSGLGSQLNGAVNTFVPALQREDDSYIGTDGNMNLIALGLDGSLVWQQIIGETPITPLYATADGGAIVTSTTQCAHNVVTDTPCSPQLGTLYTLDQNGIVTSQTPETGAVPSWTGLSYGAAPELVTVSETTGASPWRTSSFGPNQLGNPSLTRVYMPFIGCDFGVGTWGWILGQKQKGCKLSGFKVTLPYGALTQYDTIRQALINSGSIVPNSSGHGPTMCSNWFSGLGENQASAYNSLEGAVLKQQPYDGPESTLSMYAAGLWTSKDVSAPTFPREYMRTPVCSWFFRNTIAMAQVQWPRTDVYILTNPKTGKLGVVKGGQVFNTLTESTIVHEALHNLTGLGDPDLRVFLGLPKPNDPNDTTDINAALVANGCAEQ